MKKRAKELDKLWARIVRERANNTCEYCGRPGNNPHHIFTRSKRNTRFDPENGICLCSNCHTLSSSFSAHKAPRKFFQWLEGWRGKEWLDNLERRSEVCGKGTDLEAWYLYLLNYIKTNKLTKIL